MKPAGTNTKEITQQTRKSYKLDQLKNSNRPAGHDIGKQTYKKPISQNIPHCERDPNYYA